MSAFPGRIFDGDGLPMDGLVNGLTQDQIDACAGRSMVALRGLAPVARVWLLNDGTTWSDVPQAIRDAAVTLLEAGQGIVILAQRPEAEVDVRNGLMSIAPDGDAIPEHVDGHA